MTATFLVGRCYAINSAEFFATLFPVLISPRFAFPTECANKSARP